MMTVWFRSNRSPVLPGRKNSNPALLLRWAGSSFAPLVAALNNSFLRST
jgi:hypothetical protein